MKTQYKMLKHELKNFKPVKIVLQWLQYAFFIPSYHLLDSNSIRLLFLDFRIFRKRFRCGVAHFENSYSPVSITQWSQFYFL